MQNIREKDFNFKRKSFSKNKVKLKECKILNKYMYQIQQRVTLFDFSLNEKN